MQRDQQGKLSHGAMFSKSGLPSSSRDSHQHFDNLSHFQLHPVPVNERWGLGGSQRLDTLAKVM